MDAVATKTASEAPLCFIDALCDERVHRHQPGTGAAQEAARWRARRKARKPSSEAL